MTNSNVKKTHTQTQIHKSYELTRLGTSNIRLRRKIQFKGEGMKILSLILRILSYRNMFIKP